MGESIILTGYGWLAAAGGKVAPHAAWRDRISGAVMVALGVLAALPRT